MRGRLIGRREKFMIRGSKIFFALSNFFLVCLSDMHTFLMFWHAINVACDQWMDGWVGGRMEGWRLCLRFLACSLLARLFPFN